MYLRYLYYPTYSRLDGLLAGVAVAACAVFRPAWLPCGQRRGAMVLGASALLLTGCIVFFDGGGRLGFWQNVVGYPLVALAMAGFVSVAARGTWLSRWRIPGAGWFARASYSLYLSHKGAFMLTVALLGERMDGHPVWRFVAFSLVVLAVGAALHYGVERPCLRWRERRSATLPRPRVIQGASATD
jgi:peptidoglycan/LPS O-acetylase OafA/YrhL